MRTTGAENGRTVGSILLFKNSIGSTENCFFEKVYAVFALTGEALLALYLKAPSANLLFDDRLKLLEYVNGFDLLDEVLHQLFRDRIYQSEYCRMAFS